MNNNLNIKDLFQIALRDYQGNLSTIDILIGLLVTFILSLIILFFYKKSYHIKSYDHSFGISIVLSSAITFIIISAISSNVILSLGMVGALSIVRFRMAVKNPLDIIYIFWAICLGITTGAGLFYLAVISTVAVGAVSIIIKSFSSSSSFYLLSISYEVEGKGQIIRELNRYDYQIRSKTISKGIVELIIDIKLINVQDELLEKLNTLDGIINCSIVSYDDSF